MVRRGVTTCAGHLVQASRTRAASLDLRVDGVDLMHRHMYGEASVATRDPDIAALKNVKPGDCAMYLRFPELVTPAQSSTGESHGNKNGSYA